MAISAATLQRHFMSFGVSCHLAFHVIWCFMSFGVSCHLAFHVIWRFMSFGVSCDLSDHSHQRLHGINDQSCCRGPVCLQKVGAAAAAAV